LADGCGSSRAEPSEQDGLVEPGQEHAQKKREPSEQEADVLANAAKDGVETITVPAAEEVAPEPSVLLHVADHRLDGERRLKLRLMRGVSPRFWPEWNTREGWS